MTQAKVTISNEQKTLYFQVFLAQTLYDLGSHEAAAKLAALKEEKQHAAPPVAALLELLSTKNNCFVLPKVEKAQQYFDFMQKLFMRSKELSQAQTALTKESNGCLSALMKCCFWRCATATDYGQARSNYEALLTEIRVTLAQDRANDKNLDTFISQCHQADTKRILEAPLNAFLERRLKPTVSIEEELQKMARGQDRGHRREVSLQQAQWLGALPGGVNTLDAHNPVRPAVDSPASRSPLSLRARASSE